ncbi:hypothetical protein [Hydrogenophaga taeniospiralis]|uniref:hypothetical protein n=1 Tax=Hydrogenophaga taeniospiralis TaxID=65656 RepID=UPI0012FA6A90|nr:hypothetical protein [Hydrogenophaga taeniospiralis]
MQALLSPGEDIDAQCIQAEVLYGDTRVAAGAVRSTPQRSAPDAGASVRIQSSEPVTEPIVTILVRAGCGTPFTRRYVLLADLISEPARSAEPSPPATGTGTMALPPASSATGGQGGAAAPAAPAKRPDAAARATSPSPSGARPVRPRPPSVVRRPAEPARPTGPRLQLDPLDLSLNIERDPVLRLSPSLLSEPTTSEEERAAAGLLWKAINASPEEILRDAQKMAVLEAESKGLREEEVRNNAVISELNARLEQARSQRYLNWLVYLLGALLLLALLALFVVWRRKGPQVTDSDASRAWWAPSASSKAEKRPVVRSGVPRAGALDIDLNLDRESSFDEYSPLSEVGVESVPGLPPKDKREFAPSLIGVSRSVATEELFDVQQQADFFVSLGEVEQAIQVLRHHLAESQEPSALAYLDLFKLYHKLNRRNDYEALREEFNRIFNAGAPPFDQYTDESRGLEAYEAAFSRIQALWPGPKVLEVIEQSIFKEHNDTEAEVFDLEAYRELLLLHAIAKEMIQHDSESPKPANGFQHTAMQPLKAAGSKALATSVAEAAASGRQTEPLDLMPPVSPRLGLDVDLDELAEMSAFEASLPEVAVPVEPSAPSVPAPGKPSFTMAEGNLIDFEVLDFMPPDGESQNKPADPKK